jgi:PncC family amidohydrolase
VLTAISGSSAVYKGGIISYTNEIKEKLLGVSAETLAKYGAVSEPVACAMAEGARVRLQTDIAISVTGLAGPGGDEYGNPVGTVFIGYADEDKAFAKEFRFLGDREDVRKQAILMALRIVLENN